MYHTAPLRQPYILFWEITRSQGQPIRRGQPAWLSISAEITPIGWRIPMAAASQSLFVVGEMCLDTWKGSEDSLPEKRLNKMENMGKTSFGEVQIVDSSLFCIANVTMSHCILITHFRLYRHFSFQPCSEGWQIFCIHPFIQLWNMKVER